MNRDKFLARVREAAASGRQYRVAVDPADDQFGYVGVAGDLCERLATEIDQVGGMAQVVESWEQARHAVGALLTQYAAKSAICWQHQALEKLGLNHLLDQRSITRFAHDPWKDMTADSRHASILDADVGISSVDFAIAETGTLIVCAKPGHERSVSLLPPVHIAVVERSAILPDLFDLFAELKTRGYANLPSNIAFITGPSKTGDIELELTTGVHGPGKWHVIIVRSE